MRACADSYHWADKDGHHDQPTPGRGWAAAQQTDQAAARKAAIRRKQRRAAAVAAVIGVAAAILVTVGVLAFRGHSTPSSSNTTPTAFSLPALNGSGRVRLTQFRGKPTVVNFFASWCSACDSELPDSSSKPTR